MPYTHLHVHSNYSDGLAHPLDLMEHAKRLGYTALALTDHNTLDGHAALLAAAHYYQLRPILGVEIRVHSHHGHGHVVVLPQVEGEYHYLSWLIRRKKKVQIGDLKRAGMVTTGCLGGVIPQLLRRNDYWSARDTLEEYREQLDGRVILEIQPNFGTTMAWMLSLGHQLHLPIIATNDVHYLYPEDSARHVNYGLHLASEAQMRMASPLAGYLDAIETTQIIANGLWNGHPRDAGAN
jgi:DNA polymerase-3 subunit alpha